MVNLCCLSFFVLRLLINHLQAFSLVIVLSHSFFVLRLLINHLQAFPLVIVELKMIIVALSTRFTRIACTPTQIDNTCFGEYNYK
jgi:hypothetical protein